MTILVSGYTKTKEIAEELEEGRDQKSRATINNKTGAYRWHESETDKEEEKNAGMGEGGRDTANYAYNIQ